MSIAAVAPILVPAILAAHYPDLSEAVSSAWGIGLAYEFLAIAVFFAYLQQATSLCASRTNNYAAMSHIRIS